MYELESEGSDSTRVTLTYDRSEIELDNVRKMSEENFTDEVMEESLSALAAAVDGTDNPTQKSS